ncbi:MAG: caspase family protein [Crocosphaera sp.]|nr:caspase family protein [Crocosphaera sp.]
MTAEHYAIVIGINKYDALQDLEGPVNDANEFYKWLCAPQGGDLDPEKISCILSTDYSSEKGHPTPNEIEALFEPFIEAGIQGKYGKRLYIFAAGHGFGDPSDMRATAIYTANTKKQFPWHVAITHYAEWLRRNAVFDEIILIMDCCRIINSLHGIREPQYPDTQGHPQAHKISYFYGFAVGRDQKAREREFENGQYNGIFTKTLLDALKTTEPKNGKITGQLLKNQIHNSIDGIAGNTSIEPPEILLDSRRDIIFLSRQAADTHQVQVSINQHRGQEKIVVFNGAGEEVERQMAMTSSLTFHLKSGLYKVVVADTNREELFEVPKNEQIAV